MCLDKSWTNLGLWGVKRSSNFCAVLGQKLDKLRTLGSPKIVQLLSCYNDTQILRMGFAWTKVGQTKDLGESKDCPTFVRLQCNQVSDMKNEES